MAEPTKQTCQFIFKKRKVQHMQSRKRQHSSNEDDSESDTESSVVQPTMRKSKTNPNIQSSNNKRKLDADNELEESDTEAPTVSYKSDKSVKPSGPTDQNATAVLEFETEKDRDAQALFEKRLEVNKQLEGKEDDKIYRGLNNYAQYYTPKDTAAGNASSGLVRRGPIRAPSNLRATVRWDYQPDICKDYKETGFCGFGDSCKFLHDRSDYKLGWQLEREYEGGQYGNESDDDKYAVDSDEEDLPFKCVICRESFVDPVITKCKHYFCEKCALARYKKSTRCFICKVQTNGIFNPAKELIARLKKMKEKEEIHDESSDSD